MNARALLARIDIPCALFIAAVALFQLALYCTYPATPLHDPVHGWTTWADQGLYLKSARAFAAFDLSSTQHWYPPGYSLLAAPFVPFFTDPFFVPNLASLLVFAWMFQRYFRPLIGMFGVAAAFFGALVLPITTQVPFTVKYLLWLQFVIPWNTVPIAAVFMTLLCVVRDLRADDALSKDLLIGALAGAVAGIKPVELLPLGVLGCAYLAARLRYGTRPVLRIGVAAGGILAVGGVLLGLTMYIHHGFASDYTNATSYVGMSLADLPQRAIDLFIDAGPSFGTANAALFAFLAWFPILAPLALVGAILCPRQLLLPVAMVTASFLTYLAYNDFGPVRVLHYFLIHYVVWTLPVIAACGLSMAVAAARRPRWAIPCVVAVLAFYIVGALRIDLKPVAYTHAESHAVDGGRAFNLDFAATSHLDAIDFPANKAVDPIAVGNPLRLEVDRQPLRVFTGYRLIELPGRWRVIFMRPVDAKHLSFWIPDVDATHAIEVHPIRFGLRFSSSPWAAHSTNPDVVASD